MCSCKLQNSVWKLQCATEGMTRLGRDLTGAHSWSRVRDASFVRSPLIVRSFFMSKRPIKCLTDISHTIDTHCIALKHITRERKYSVKLAYPRFMPLKKQFTQKCTIYSCIESHSRCRRVCCFIGTDLVTYQWIICSEWVPSEQELN